jgi:hypothetical protein
MVSSRQTRISTKVSSSRKVALTARSRAAMMRKPWGNPAWETLFGGLIVQSK